MEQATAWLNAGLSQRRQRSPLVAPNRVLGIPLREAALLLASMGARATQVP